MARRARYSPVPAARSVSLLQPPSGAFGEGLRVDVQPAAHRPRGAREPELQAGLTEVSARHPVGLMVGEVAGVVGAPHVEAVEEQLSAGVDEPARVVEKAVEALQVQHHADPVAEHEQGVEGATLEVHDIGVTRRRHAALDHDRDRFRADVDGGDREPPPLEYEGVDSGTGADVEHVTPAPVEGGGLDGGELGLGPEEEAGRELHLEAVISADDDARGAVPPRVSEQGTPERGHRAGVHRPHRAHTCTLNRQRSEPSLMVEAIATSTGLPRTVSNISLSQPREQEQYVSPRCSGSSRCWVQKQRS